MRNPGTTRYHLTLTLALSMLVGCQASPIAPTGTGEGTIGKNSAGRVMSPGQGTPGVGLGTAQNPGSSVGAGKTTGNASGTGSVGGQSNSGVQANPQFGPEDGAWHKREGQSQYEALAGTAAIPFSARDGLRYVTPDGLTTVVIPPGALNADGKLRIKRIDTTSRPVTEILVPGISYYMDLGGANLNLDTSMKVTSQVDDRAIEEMKKRDPKFDPAKYSLAQDAQGRWMLTMTLQGPQTAPFEAPKRDTPYYLTVETADYSSMPVTRFTPTGPVSNTGFKLLCAEGCNHLAGFQTFEDLSIGALMNLPPAPGVLGEWIDEHEAAGYTMIDETNITTADANGNAIHLRATQFNPTTHQQNCDFADAGCPDSGAVAKGLIKFNHVVSTRFPSDLRYPANFPSGNVQPATIPSGAVFPATRLTGRVDADGHIVLGADGNPETEAHPQAGQATGEMITNPNAGQPDGTISPLAGTLYPQSGQLVQPPLDLKAIADRYKATGTACNVPVSTVPLWGRAKWRSDIDGINGHLAEGTAANPVCISFRGLTSSATSAANPTGAGGETVVVGRERPVGGVGVWKTPPVPLPTGQTFEKLSGTYNVQGFYRDPRHVPHGMIVGNLRVGQTDNALTYDENTNVVDCFIPRFSPEVEVILEATDFDFQGNEDIHLTYTIGNGAPQIAKEIIPPPVATPDALPGAEVPHLRLASGSTKVSKPFAFYAAVGNSFNFPVSQDPNQTLIVTGLNIFRAGKLVEVGALQESLRAARFVYVPSNRSTGVWINGHFDLRITLRNEMAK